MAKLHATNQELLYTFSVRYYWFQAAHVYTAWGVSCAPCLAVRSWPQLVLRGLAHVPGIHCIRISGAYSTHGPFCALFNVYVHNTRNEVNNLQPLTLSLSTFFFTSRWASFGPGE